MCVPFSLTCVLTLIISQWLLSSLSIASLILVISQSQPFSQSKSAPVNIIVGSHVWVEDPKQAWVGGEVFKINGDEVHVRTTDGKTVVTNISKVFPWIMKPLLDLFYVCLITKT